MANNRYIDRLRMVIFQFEGCDSTHVESVPVHEVFGGKTVWDGMVEVFDLLGHPKAKRAYAWTHPEGTEDKGERFVVVLEIPPVDSPKAAVQVAAVNDIKKSYDYRKPK